MLTSRKKKGSDSNFEMLVEAGVEIIFLLIITNISSDDDNV